MFSVLLEHCLSHDTDTVFETRFACLHRFTTEINEDLLYLYCSCRFTEGEKVICWQSQATNVSSNSEIRPIKQLMNNFLKSM